MKHSTYEAVVKSFQALSIGVGGLFIVVADAAAGSPAANRPVKINLSRDAQQQVAAPFESEADRLDDLAGRFHKPNRIGRSQVREMLKE